MMLYLFAAMLGWCGTLAGWRYKPQPQPWRPEPEPWKPQPDPWLPAIGALGGVIASATFQTVIADAGFAALAATAFLGGAALGSVAIGLRRR